MGEKYLWVNSLCIIQNDAEIKHNMILQMHLIYMNEKATIGAMNANDASAGLPGVRPNSRPPQPLKKCKEFHLL